MTTASCDEDEKEEHAGNGIRCGSGPRCQQHRTRNNVAVWGVRQAELRRGSPGLYPCTPRRGAPDGPGGWESPPPRTCRPRTRAVLLAGARFPAWREDIGPRSARHFPGSAGPGLGDPARCRQPRGSITSDARKPGWVSVPAQIHHPCVCALAFLSRDLPNRPLRRWPGTEKPTMPGPERSEAPRIEIPLSLVAREADASPRTAPHPSH